MVFTFCNPDVAFLSKIAFSVFAVNDSGWLITHTAAGDQISLLNGTGPYKLDQWQKGTEIDYSAFDGYWGDKAVTPNAVLRWQGESAARLQELQAGTIDGMTLVGPTDFGTVEGNPDLKLQPSGGLNTLYLGMNHDVAPWDNDAVRKAIGDRHRPTAHRRQLSCRQARKSRPTSPRARSRSPARATIGRPRTSMRHAR